MIIKITSAAFLFFLATSNVFAQNSDDFLNQTLNKRENIDSELDDLEKGSNKGPVAPPAPDSIQAGGVSEGMDFDKLETIKSEAPIRKLPTAKKSEIKKKEVVKKEKLEEQIEEEVGQSADQGLAQEAVDEADMEELSDTRYEKKIAKFYRGKKRMNDNEWKERIGKSFEEVYVVVSGDTLWGISTKFLDSPWYWPKLWELNSYITNPHIIEPGQEIRFKFSAEEGPSITLIPGKISEEIKEEKEVDYSVLEKDAAPQLFDNQGFFKEGLRSLKVNLSSGKNIGGGEFYFDNDPETLGEIYASKAERGFLVSGDEIELKSEIPCTPGKMLSVTEKVRSSIFAINGDVKLLQETANKMCSARVEKVYGPMKRNMKLVEQINIPFMESRTEDRVLTGRIVDLSPVNTDSRRKISSEGDRIFVKFNDDEAPMPGTLIYLYEIKDPVTGKEVDPHVTGVAKLVHTSGKYATADIVASTKTAGTETTVTTRF